MNEVVCYDLEKQPTTFDFATWACVIKSNNVDEVAIVGDHFKWKKDYSEEVARRRLKNIVYPIAELAGMTVVDPGERPRVYAPHLMSAVQKCYRDLSKIWKFPYEKRHDHITVTIRDSWRTKHRNSNRKEWDKFISWAENNGEKVVVLEDREENPYTVQERWDLYQCKMNLGVSNGPISMLCLSDAPYVVMGYGNGAHDVYLLGVHHWMWKNYQHPWANRNQKLVWRPDTFTAIQRAYIAASGAH